MKIFLLLLSLLGVYSCSKKPIKYVTIDLELTCTPMLYFDTLSSILLTNDRSDLGGRTTSVWRYMMSRNDRVYKKHLVKKGGHYYIDSVQRKYYEYFLVAGNIGTDRYWGFKEDVNFSGNNKDTILYRICIEPAIRSVDV